MDRFSASFPITTTMTDSSSSTSSDLSHSIQNLGHPQNVHFPNNSETLAFPTTPSPYFVPYDQNLGFPFMHMNQPHDSYPMYSFPTGQSSTVEMPSYQPQTREEDRKMKELAWMKKMARDKRKQARQRSRSSAATARASSVAEGTIRGQQPVTRGESNSNVQVTLTQNVFCAPHGKRLTEILTKKLQNSDVNSLGRIVLPKWEAELMLPALRDKEGIDVLLKDVYSDLQWSLKYKYWTNNKSRMYVLENTRDFVNHYELQTGDSVTLYEDESKNLYVLTKKEQNPVKEASIQVAEQANIEAAATSSFKGQGQGQGQTIVKDNDRPNTFNDDIYGELGSIFEDGCNYHPFDNLTDYNYLC